MPTRQEIARALESIFSGIAHLNDSFPSRQFTIDGRLVGDVGEVIAAMVYEIVREAVCGSPNPNLGFRPRHDQISELETGEIRDRHQLMFRWLRTSQVGALQIGVALHLRTA